MNGLLLLVALAATPCRAVDAGPIVLSFDKPPSQEVLNGLTVELPYVLPDGKTLAGAHVILYDASGQGNNAVWHEPQWKRQAELLEEKLRSKGVPWQSIHVHPVKTTAEVLGWIARVAGPKKLYLFGHAGPLTLLVGKEELALKDVTTALREGQVDAVCDYGCSFLNAGECEIKDVQSKLAQGQQLCLYGHQRPSSKQDDSPWDEQNPLMRCEIGQDCAALYQPRLEYAKALAQKSLPRLKNGPRQDRNASLIQLLEAAAAYDGSAPVKVQTGPVMPQGVAPAPGK